MFEKITKQIQNPILNHAFIICTSLIYTAAAMFLLLWELKYSKTGRSLQEGEWGFQHSSLPRVDGKILPEYCQIMLI
jgi:hypothetical protein